MSLPNFYKAGEFNYFVGWHQPVNRPSGCQLFDKCMVSINRLENRKSDFPVHDWMLDNGGFFRITSGKPHISTRKFAKQIRRWRKNTGNLLASVSQDWLCEPMAISKTGLDIATHQHLCILRYDNLLQHLQRFEKDEFMDFMYEYLEYNTDEDPPDYYDLDEYADDCLETGFIEVPYLMPVLQGWLPEDYINHLKAWGDRITPGMWVGVGSLCSRSKNPRQIATILQAIKYQRPDIKLHGFGVKYKSLMNNQVRSLLYSADSQAHGFIMGSGKQKRVRSHDPLVALAYAEAIKTQTPFQPPN